MNRKCIQVALLLLLFLSLANAFRIHHVLQSFNEMQYAKAQNDLQIIINDTKKVSDAIFLNMIDTQAVIDIFKQAHSADETQKAHVRTRLYELLKRQYGNFTLFDVQQLHFHLPDNESFLRFHKPSKFGDDLTGIRDSVAYVNAHHKAISGFEEGRIFNGYRFVYPLFDNAHTHIGSVEVSVSLLALKKQFEKNNRLHLDYIITKEVVDTKVFASQMSNYAPYFSLPNFYIQKSLKDFDDTNGSHPATITAFMQDLQIQQEIQKMRKHLYYKVIDNSIYFAHFMPLLNDFTQQQVGYAIVFGELGVCRNEHPEMSTPGASLS